MTTLMCVNHPDTAAHTIMRLVDQPSTERPLCQECALVFNKYFADELCAPLQLELLITKTHNIVTYNRLQEDRPI